MSNYLKMKIKITKPHLIEDQLISKGTTLVTEAFYNAGESKSFGVDNVYTEVFEDPTRRELMDMINEFPAVRAVVRDDGKIWAWRADVLHQDAINDPNLGIGSQLTGEYSNLRNRNYITLIIDDKLVTELSLGLPEDLESFIDVRGILTRMFDNFPYLLPDLNIENYLN